MSEVKKSSPVKDIFSQTAFYGLGLVLNRSIGIILLPLYTSFFTTEEMGVYAIVFSLWLFINVIYLGGIETSFLKFFVDHKETSQRIEIFSTTLITIFVTSVIYSSLIYFFSDTITRWISFENPVKGSALIKILALLLISDALYRIPLLLLRAELKAQVYFILTMFTLVTNVSLNFLFILYYGMNIEAIFYAYMISAFLTFLLSLAFTRKFLGFKFSFKQAKHLIAYGNKFVYVGIFIILIDQSDRFFLKYFYNESMVGIYQANYRLAAVMSLVVSSFRFSWTPYFLNIAGNPENKKIISNIFTYFVFAGMSLFLFFAFFTEPIVKANLFGFTILDSAYWGGLNIIPLVLLSYLFSGLATNLNAASFYANKTIYILWLTMGGFIVYSILNFLLIPSYEMLGAAYASMLANLFMFVVIYFISQRIYKVSYNLKAVFSLAAITAAVYALHLILPSTLIISGCLFLLFIASVHLLKVIDLKKASILFKK